MKLFGKKTLALFLALAMVMPMCAFATETTPVAVTGVSLDKTSLTLEAGKSENLTATVAPETATNKEVTWSSSADAVATVSAGTVAAVKPGNATITVTTTDGAKTATCAVTVTKGTISSVTADKTGITVPYGTTKAEAEAAIKAGVKLTAKNTNGAEFEVAAASWACDTYSSAVNAANKFTATVEGQTVEVTVTVIKETIKSVNAIAEVEVPVGATAEKVKGKLPKTVTVKLSDDSTKTLTVGTDLTAWTGSYDPAATAANTYKYTATLADATAANYNVDSGVKFEVNVKSKTAWKLDDISITAVTEGDDDTITTDLDDKVDYAIESLLGKTIASAAFTFTDLDLGTASTSTGTYYVSLTSSEEEELYEKGALTDVFNYTTTVGGVTYSGKVTLTLRTTDVADTFGYAGGSLSSIASVIDTLLGGDMEAIEFTSMELDGGTLWEDDDFEDEVYDDSYYTPSELSAMYYLPNGTGDVSELEYVAYVEYDADDEEVDKDKGYVEGVIYLYSDEFLLLSASITNKEVVQFSGDEFEEAFLDLDDEYEELTYVTFTKPDSGDGYLYYEYDEDDSKHTAITTSSSGNKNRYYVEEEDDGDKLIDDVTYVPAKKTSGVITIKFKAFGIDEDDDDVKNIEGIYQITVQEAADITIEAGKGEEVEIDPELFQDYLEDTVNSKKDLTIVSVTISGAPRSKTAGYLITDGDELTKSGDKTFYADEDDVDVDDKKYDLNDLSFEGGTKATTTRAYFTIKYKIEGSKSTKTLEEATIDFIVGSSHSLNGAIKAAQTMSFYQELDAFEALGDNDNVYVEFTSLPKNGKLYYNYGTANQEDVTIGTDYYLTTSAGKKQLRYVTFVPSYSSSKIAQTASFGVKGYNKNDKAVSGTVNVAVTYASYSAYFTDVKTSNYADSVDFLYNRGITTGMTTTTFGPNENVTRGQFVTFLYRAAGQPTVTAANKFTDVKTSDYYYNAVRWAVQNGITNGRSATIFDPNANVTYQEIMTFLYRYDVSYLKHTSYTNGSTSVVYDYAKVDTWAQTAVKWAVGKGVLTSGNLNPTTAGTRANVALFMHRMLTL
ncbi:MAG: S-layer homology domain-containing protein [Clostridia bacterium]|nr:S-layer homology domain-containing protein [Clostridia bacterium]